MTNIPGYSYTIPNSQQQALMMPMPQDNVGSGGQTGGYQTGNGMMGLSPQMLQSIMQQGGLSTQLNSQGAYTNGLNQGLYADPNNPNLQFPQGATQLGNILPWLGGS